MKLIFKYLKPYLPVASLSILCLLGQAGSELMLPSLMSDVVNRGVVFGDSAAIWSTGSIMLAVALVCAVCAVGVGYFSSRVSAAFASDLRRDVFTKVTSFSAAEYERFSTASLITRTTNDVQQVQMLITMGMRIMCFAPVMGIGGVVFALSKSPGLSWTVGLAVICVLSVVVVTIVVAMPRFRLLQKLIDRINLVSRESLTGMMVVRAFGNEGHEELRFDEANLDLTKTNRFVQRVMSVLMPTMTLIMNALTLMIVWFGGKSIAAGGLAIGDMMAFMQYAMHVVMSFLFVAMMFIMVPRAAVSIGRIREILDTVPTVVDSRTPVQPERIRGEIEFVDVCFSYEEAEHDVLSHISFKVSPGERIGIIGPTGSGKSTLVKLIPRFHDVTRGSVRVDGIDVRELPQKLLRDSIGFVPQRANLFTGDVRGNICYGREDASDAEVMSALDTAQASGFVSELPEGLCAPIARGGGNVSGGQRQRLCIARALVRRAPIYIFDDSFSALDSITDAALRRALTERVGDAAVLIVAQRVSTIMDADRIIVLDEGKMTGIGTHAQLMASCPEYREIAESQLGKGESA